MTRNQRPLLLRVGGKNFTEQEILGQMLAQLLETNSRLLVERKLNLGGTMICFSALVAEDLCLHVEYT
jgi:glycine betaine/choline ABC-type transport system substrate-binding protein